MGTVLRKNGFQFMIYEDDHDPAHVHTWYGGKWARIWLSKKVHITERVSMNKNELSKAMQIAQEHRDFLLKEWKRIHGKPKK